MEVGDSLHWEDMWKGVWWGTTALSLSHLEISI
jgi:hypothetical protein